MKRVHKNLRGVVALLAASLVLLAMGCSEDPAGPGENITVDPNQNQEENQNQNQEESGYEAGVLDGVWDLYWGEENFGSFTIEHDLTEQVLRVAFDTVDDGEGQVDSSSWQNDEFTAQWDPYPLTNENETFTIVRAGFAEDSEDRLEGLMGAITSFDFRNFHMVRVR